MTDQHVQAALNQAAQDFLTANASITTVADGVISGLPTITAADIGWENRKFKPTGKATWASVFYVPNTPNATTLGKTGSDEMTGFLQIDINAANDSGEDTHRAWFKKSRLYFHGGRVFTYTGQNVIVTSSGMSQGRHSDGFFRKSITVNFRAQLKRPQLV